VQHFCYNLYVEYKKEQEEVAPMKLYKQLSFEERAKIVLLQQLGYSVGEMAEELGRHPSTIFRELTRNSDPLTGRYVARTAQSTYKHRLENPQGRIRDEDTRRYVLEKIKNGWSPERICGRVALDIPGKSLCPETIYMFVYKQEPKLRERLTRHHMKRHRKWQRKSHECHIKNRVLVDLRDISINKRERVGDWESDVVAGLKRKNSGITVMVDRKSRFTKLKKLNDIVAKENRDNIKTSLRQVPEVARKSITYDNGKENAYHEEINKVFGCCSYFCHEGKPQEKGTVENTIGLLRRIFPKGTDFDTISAAKIKAAENWLNDLPKKCLGWKTPRETFEQLCCT